MSKIKYAYLKEHTWIGTVRRIRTSLSLPEKPRTHAEQSWRHSARAAARLSLKLSLL